MYDNSVAYLFVFAAVIVQEHDLSVCPERVISCKRKHLGCEVSMQVTRLLLHEEHGCLFRGITCPLECGKEFRQDEKNKHLVR